MINVETHNIIVPKYFGLVNNLGSSLLPAHGSGGASVTINPIAAEKISAPKRGRLGRRGSGGGMPSRPSEAPPSDSLEAEPSKILFSLIEKIFKGRTKEKIVKSILLGGERMRAGGGAGAYDFFQSHHALRACVSRGSVQKKLEFQPKGTARCNFASRQLLRRVIF